MFTMASFGLLTVARLWGGIAAIVCGALRASEAALRWTAGVAVSRWAVVVSVLLFVLASGAATAGFDAALIGRGAPAEVAVIARPIWMGHGIAVATAPSPVTSGRGRRIFSCVTKAGRARMARLTGAAM
jgi:hypothetical protein